MIFYFIVSFLSLTCIVQVSHLKLLEICAVFNCLSYEPYPSIPFKKCFDIFLCIYLLNIKFQFLKISFGITFLYMLMYNFSWYFIIFTLLNQEYRLLSLFKVFALFTASVTYQHLLYIYINTFIIVIMNEILFCCINLLRGTLQIYEVDKFFFIY